MPASVSLGPFALPLDLVVLVLALIVAMVAGWLVQRKHDKHKGSNVTDAVFALALAGLVAARMVFVLRYGSLYASHPLDIIDIRDGGFSLVGGAVGMMLYAGFVFWRKPVLRRPLGVAMLAGALVWGAATGALSLMQSTRPMRPDAKMATLTGQPVTLDVIAAAHPNQPMVVNLWASWCPPCRAEMPMLAAAQKADPDVTFVFANQGESAHTVHEFLAAESLHMNNVLLAGERLAQRVGARAYPTTLFYDANGRLVNRHMGMLSRATLARALQRVEQATPDHHPTTEGTQ